MLYDGRLSAVHGAEMVKLVFLSPSTVVTVAVPCVLYSLSEKLAVCHTTNL